MTNKWIGALGLLLSGQLMASELVIESWRADDKALWEQKSSRFEAANPGIKVKFNPVPNVNYMPTLWENLKAGKAGDLITCRPFDDSLALFKAGTWQKSPKWLGWKISRALPKRLGKPILGHKLSVSLWLQ